MTELSLTRGYRRGVIVGRSSGKRIRVSFGGNEGELVPKTDLSHEVNKQRSDADKISHLKTSGNTSK